MTRIGRRKNNVLSSAVAVAGSDVTMVVVATGITAPVMPIAGVAGAAVGAVAAIVAAAVGVAAGATGGVAVGTDAGVAVATGTGGAVGSGISRASPALQVDRGIVLVSILTVPSRARRRPF